MATMTTAITTMDALKYAAVGLIVGCLVVALGRAHGPRAVVGATATADTLTTAPATVR
jgi:hypothetical protein